MRFGPPSAKIGWMRAYSMDIRQKVVKAMASGESASSAARRFDVDPTTACDWRRRAAEGRLEPGVGRRRGHAKLTGDDLARMRRAVEERPGVTAMELAALLGNKVVESTICRALRKMGLRLKKSRSSPGSKSVPTSSDAATSSCSPG